MITCKTSAVAVCCSNASRVSVISRVFSIAMTAWSAKVRHQLDLPLGEQLHALTEEGEHADYCPVTQKWHPEIGAYPSDRGRLGQSIFGVGGDIGDMYDVAFKSDPPDRGVTAGSKRLLPHERNTRRCRKSHATPDSDRLRPRASRSRTVGVAQPRRGFEQRVEHRLQVESRATDDLQHLAGRGLVFERFLQIARAIAHSFSSRAFSIAMTACAAKFSSSAICLSENGHFLTVNIDETQNRVVFTTVTTSEVRAPPRSTRARRLGSPAR